MVVIGNSSATSVLLVSRAFSRRIVLNSGVCVLAPMNGRLEWPDGRSIELTDQLPAIIRARLGKLPEYVAPSESGDWAEWRRNQARQDAHGLIQRVRTDIILVVDGTIVDLHRIPLPKDTAITDRRFQQN